MNTILWLAGLALAVLVIYLLLVMAATRGILRSYRRSPARVRREFGFSEPEDLGLEAERLEIEVEPGLKLRGFLFRTSAPHRGLLVYHHGIWDACRPRLQLADRMMGAGFDVLMYDSRGHGESDGRYCTYGLRESEDLTSVLDELASRGIDLTRVVVVGHSMGAATAVYAAVQEPRIKALVLESCYRDLSTAIRDYARALVPFLPEVVIRPAERRAARKAGFDPEQLSPLKLMPHLDIPVLIVQGTRDRRIKPRYAQEHFDATPEPRDLHWIEGARHGRVWHEGGETYMQTLERWLTLQMPVLEPQSR